jgi:hypothetical protein
MKLTLLRKTFTDLSTMGELLIDGEHECWALEDKCRRVKIEGKTAIWVGTYEVVINWSERFQRQMPLLLNVPGFEGIRIHCGNDNEDTAGCILLGQVKLVDQLANSRLAFDAFFPKLQVALQTGKVYITIMGGLSYEPTRLDQASSSKQNDLPRMVVDFTNIQSPPKEA